MQYDDLAAIQGKIKMLRQELTRLEAAESVILEVRAKGQTPSAFQSTSIRPATSDLPANNLSPIPPPPLKSLTDAVLRALANIGPAKTAEIIGWVRKFYEQDANSHSIRSMLSMWATRGRIKHDSEKGVWFLEEAALREDSE